MSANIKGRVLVYKIKQSKRRVLRGRLRRANRRPVTNIIRGRIGGWRHPVNYAYHFKDLL